MTKLRECPFCGGTNTQVRTSTHWTGMRSEIISATVMHWCDRGDGQLQSTLQVKGRTEEEATCAWNRRADDRYTVTPKGREMLGEG